MINSYCVPLWYRLLGKAVKPWFMLVRSPRTGPWKPIATRPVWIHAASLGELKGSIRLAQALAPKAVVLTSTTPKGLEKLQREFPGIPSGLLPLDECTCVEAFLDAHQPRCAVFLEAEAWPCLLASLAHRQIPVALAAFRAEPTSLRRWRQFGRRFPNWTQTVSIVWTQSQSQVQAVAALGFRQLRAGTGLKWAGSPIPNAPPIAADRFAALSIHLRDFPQLLRLAQSAPQTGWLWYPRRLALRTPLWGWAAIANLVVTRDFPPGAGEVWIAPAFGMVPSTLPGCRRAWVSPGHDTQEPSRLGVPEVYTGSPPQRVVDQHDGANQTLAEIIQWTDEFQPSASKPE